MATSISSLIQLCLQTYGSVVEGLRESVFAHEDTGVCVLWEDQLGRLRVWTANIGAHQTGQSSLDYRLRDASHIRQLIVKLLEDLSQTLKDVQNLIAEDNSLDTASDDSLVSFSIDPARELTGLHEELVSIVDSLYQMSVLVRRPARHDILIDRDPEDVAKFEPFDIRHVEEKFPDADRELVRKLGAANTRRRKHLNHLKRHHAKLGKGVEKLGGTQSDAAMSEMSGTIATQFEIKIDNEAETSSEAGLSQTSYATSLGTGERVNIPTLPQGSIYGSPFECPYCFHMIKIQRHGEWQKHIMEDITPYSCIFPECPMQNMLLDSRHEWFKHLQKVHRLYLSQHGEDYEMSPRTESKHIDSPATKSCPLCAQALTSSRQFERHVARHLQELALFVLGWQEADDTNELLSESSGISSDEANESPTGDAAKMFTSHSSASLDYVAHIEDDSTSLKSPDQVNLSHSRLISPPQSGSTTITEEQAPSAGSAQPIDLDIWTPIISSEGTSTSLRDDTETSFLSSQENSLKMVIHLPKDSSQTQIAILDLASACNVVSNVVAETLGMKMNPYNGETFIDLSGQVLEPLGQLTLDWHVMGKAKTYTTTFLVIEANKAFDVILGAETAGKLGFTMRTML